MGLGLMKVVVGLGEGGGGVDEGVVEGLGVVIEVLAGVVGIGSGFVAGEHDC